jgi:hypothetical protein
MSRSTISSLGPARTGQPDAIAYVELRLDEIEPAFDAVEAIVHPVEAKAHFRHLPRHVRDTALDRAKPAALLALLLTDLAKFVAYSTEMFKY